MTERPTRSSTATWQLRDHAAARARTTTFHLLPNPTTITTITTMRLLRLLMLLLLLLLRLVLLL